MKIKHVLMDAAGDTSGGGGGADTVAAGGGADTLAGGGGGEKSLLETMGKGGGGADTVAAAAGADTVQAAAGDDKLTQEQRLLQSAEKDTRRPKEVPAKYWDAEKGEVKYDAWAKSTQALETRMRDVGLPPKAADEYKFEVPKEMADLGVQLDETTNKAFRDKALALGLTQKQYEGVMGEYFAQIGTLANQSGQFSADKAKADLLTFYKTDDALRANVRLAYQAFSAYADKGDMELIDQIGNIPAVVRVLAKVGKEMGEDPGISADTVLAGDSIEHLMRGKAGDEDAPYWNPKHPAHASTVAKVTKYHEAQAAANRRRQV
jgi:hypothetical protein